MSIQLYTPAQLRHLLERAGLTVNKNAIPFDTQSRFVTGGIRIGTPAVTTRGLKEQDMVLVADWINRAIINKDQEKELAAIRNDVQQLCSAHPLYPGSRYYND